MKAPKETKKRIKKAKDDGCYFITFQLASSTTENEAQELKRQLTSCFERLMNERITEINYKRLMDERKKNFTG